MERSSPVPDRCQLMYPGSLILWFLLPRWQLRRAAARSSERAPYDFGTRAGPDIAEDLHLRANQHAASHLELAIYLWIEKISGDAQHIIAFGLCGEWRVEMASCKGYQCPSPRRTLRKQQGTS
ncbi:hypothetical protein [Rhizobium sp. GR12]|uniref:hypothetical protein n=1 Tax=Rhizobium TaxID=379 RepID=UPI002FBD5B5A